MSKTMAGVYGDLNVRVVKGVDLQNKAVFGACNPYVLVKLKSSVDSFTTSVKDGEANPTWQDTFSFRNTSSSDELQISLMEKEGTREGVVSVSDYLPSVLWGFPGVGGAERVLHVTMPSTGGGRKADRPSMGSIVLQLQFRAELPYRAPFGLLALAAAKTGIVTEKVKIDMVMDKILNILFRPFMIAGDVAGRMNRTQKLVSGGAVALTGAGASAGLMMLAIPVAFIALLFLPLTLTGGFFLAMTALALLPFILVVGWIILCSRPVQCRVWMPTLFWMVVKLPIVKLAVIKTRSQSSGQ